MFMHNQKDIYCASFCLTLIVVQEPLALNALMVPEITCTARNVFNKVQIKQG
jgi:hypothetical protein